jgi:hypothetical protein
MMQQGLTPEAGFLLILMRRLRVVAFQGYSPFRDKFSLGAISSCQNCIKQNITVPSFCLLDNNTVGTFETK